MKSVNFSFLATTHWCTINYYELDTQIGQTFKVHRDQVEVTVDGGMDPSGIKSNRFCLGALPNVHRSEASEKARFVISFERKTIRLHFMKNI